MATEPSNLLFLCILIFVHLFVLTIAQSNQLYHICSENGNFTTGSDYKSNLNNLLSTFSSDTKTDYGFYNGSYGENTDKVNAISLCRGDKKPETCRSCIKNSSQELTQLCPNQKEAYIWYDDCMLRYTNRSIFSRVDLTYFWMYNLNNVTDKNEFHEVLNDLLGNLTGLAALGDSRKKFAVGNATTKNSHQTVYALVQCTPDLSKQDCKKCLNKAIELIPECCEGRQGGRVITASCHFRYEKELFYDPAAITVVPPSPAPLSVIPPPPQATAGAVPPRASTAVKLVETASIVQTTIANVFPVLLLWSLQHV